MLSLICVFNSGEAFSWRGPTFRCWTKSLDKEDLYSSLERIFWTLSSMATPFHDVKIEDMHRCIQVLRLLSPFSAIGSLFAQSVALLTNEWLYTEELMPNPKFQKLNISTDEFLSKNTVSGLWIICQNESESCLIDHVLLVFCLFEYS